MQAEELQKFYYEINSELDVMEKSGFDVKKLKEKLLSLNYNNINEEEAVYELIKIEMSIKLSSSFYEKLRLLKDFDLLQKIESLVQKDIMNFINYGMNDMNLSELLTIFTKCNNYTSEVTLMFVSYLENRDIVVRTLERVLNNINKEILENQEIYNKENFAAIIKRDFLNILSLKEKIKELNKVIMSRAIPSLLSVGIGVGIVGYQVGEIKKANTHTFYETSIEEVIKDGDFVRGFSYTKDLERISDERLCVLKRYLENHSLENDSRYVVDYSIPYNSKIPLESYMNVNISSFKPLGNARLVDASELNFSSNGEVLVFSRYFQDLNKHYDVVDKKEVFLESIGFSIICLLVESLFLALLLSDTLNEYLFFDYSESKGSLSKILKERKSSVDCIGVQISKISELLDKLEESCREVDSYLLKYNELEDLLYLTDKSVDLSEVMKQNNEFKEFLTDARGIQNKLIRKKKW